MVTGIHHVAVDYARRGDQHAIRSIKIDFGSDHWVEIASRGKGNVQLTLGNQELTATVRASGKNCQISRAINLLRLYLPESRGSSGHPGPGSER